MLLRFSIVSRSWLGENTRGAGKTIQARGFSKIWYIMVDFIYLQLFFMS